MLNYLTIDVEDYFQVSNFENIIAFDQWHTYQLRVERNTSLLLEILEKSGIFATFFILGWIAEKMPRLVRLICDAGHEIGCHSYAHRLIYRLTPQEFREDTYKAKDLLEQIIGKNIYGYRAPSYSITKKSLWALRILEELGFRYDSSIFPTYHDRYGIPDAPRFKYTIPGCNLIEYPITTAIFWGYKMPIAGGGYFRLFPYWFSKMALRKINSKEQQSFMFYLHPWELDKDQPRFEEASKISKFRHYVNLSTTHLKFKQLLADFEFRPISNFKV